MNPTLRSLAAALLVPVLLAVSLMGAAQMGRAPQDEARATTLALLAIDPATLCAAGTEGSARADHCPVCYLLRPADFSRHLPPPDKAALDLPACCAPGMRPPAPRQVRDPALGLRAPPAMLS